MMVWPVVYPPRPKLPPTDNDRIFQAVLPYFNARSWCRSGTELQHRLTTETRAERRRLAAFPDRAFGHAKYHQAELLLRLSRLPKQLQQRAIAICQTAKL